MPRITAILTLGVLLNACAFTDIPLTLPTQGLEATVPGGRGRQVVIVIPFSDEREVRHRCGMQKNGYNMDTADAVCQSDPTTWIAQLLADELRASGFSVQGGGDEYRRSALHIDGALLKLFVEPVIGTWTGSLEADLSVRLRATSQTGLDGERTFFLKGWKGGLMVSTKKPFDTALHRATQALLEEMVRAIMALMDSYPDLGSLGESGAWLALHAGSNQK